MVTLTFNNVRGIIVKKKNNTEKQLTEIKPTNEVKEEQIIELLKILIKNSDEIKEILRKLKERFV